MVQEFNSNFLNLTAVSVTDLFTVGNDVPAFQGDIPGQYARYWINSQDQQISLANFVEYITRWNRNYLQNVDYVDLGNLATERPYNFRIRKTGIYLIEARYTSYDLTDFSDTLRLRLRGQVGSPIANSGAGQLLHTFQDGFIDNTYNGGAYKQGSYILRVTPDMLPYFIITTNFATGGSSQGNTSTYPVFDNNNGLEPYFSIVRLGNYTDPITPQTV
jgi:hypothetical protein